jgi:hypothetical protein
MEEEFDLVIDQSESGDIHYGKGKGGVSEEEIVQDGCLESDWSLVVVEEEKD